MARLIKVEADQDDMVCSNCDMKFSIIWCRDGFTERIYYCPFCGDEIDEEDEDD